MKTNLPILVDFMVILIRNYLDRGNELFEKFDSCFIQQGKGKDFFVCLFNRAPFSYF